ncbi:MAG TPA: glycosyltransferase family 2 protein [Candidatus Methylacidiphilales bacterium]|nr:glycosyltransferase family 2 protein [Candidatus Methylacidiphilales bacterium]
MKPIGIIIVTYQSERHVGPLLRSLAATVEQERCVISIFDNGSSDGTVAEIEREAKALNLVPRLERSPDNLGFTRANNEAYARLQAETPCETIILLNPDTVVHAGWWEALAAALQDTTVGTVMPLLLLPDGTVNSRGNGLHFLGLGFVQGYGEKVSRLPESIPLPLFSGSGAALAFRAATLEAMNARLGTTGIFWEELFLYAEDTDLGWRMRLAGLENRLVTASRVTHDHRFWRQPLDAPGDRLFWIERNRYLLLLANFKPATLMLLLPWIVTSEAALGLGLWKLYPDRLRLWQAVWREARSPGFRARRRRLQAARSSRDQEILRAMTGSIRHGALPFRTVDRWLDAGLRWSHRFLCFVVRW